MSKTFLVYIPDDVEHGLERRLKVRGEHIGQLWAPENIKLVAGGPTINEKGDMNGSIMFFQANAEEEVRARVEKDAYFRYGVWDQSKIAIWEFSGRINN